MNILRCDHCASTDLEKLADGDYRCNHCDTRQHLASRPPPQPIPSPRHSAPASQTPARSKAAAVALLVAGVAGLAVARAAIRENRRAELRRRLALIDSSRRYASPYSSVSNHSLPSRIPPAEFGSQAIVAPKLVRGEFKNPVALPDSLGNVYFVGLFHNTGQAVVQKPRVEVTLWDAQKQKVAVGFGYAAANDVLPGEQTPVRILVQKPPAYASTSFHIAPEEKRFGQPQRFALEVQNAKLEPSPFKGYHLSGIVVNKSPQTVQYTRVVVLLIGAKQEIVGYGDGMTGQKDIPSGDRSPFSVRVNSVSSQPRSFRVYTSANAGRTP